MYSKHEDRENVRKRFILFRWIIALMGVMLLAMLITACLVEIEDLVVGEGIVEGIRQWDLKTVVSTRTTAIRHHEGEEVRQGETIVEFDSRELEERLRKLQDELQDLEQQLSVKKQEVELLKSDPLPAYYRHTKLQMEEAQERFERNELELKVNQDLFERKIITRKELMRVELEHLSSRKTLERLKEDWKKLSSGMANEILRKAAAEQELLQRRITAKNNEIAAAAAHRDDYRLKAPDNGVITDVPPRAGGYYDKGDIVVRFAANSNKKVIAFVDERHIFKVAPDQEVRIYCNQYNYLDYGFFTGRVTDIFQLPEIKNGRKFYPVRIVLTSEQHPLRFGAGCEVKIVTGKDKIICVLLGLKGEAVKTRLKRRKSVPPPETPPAAEKSLPPSAK